MQPEEIVEVSRSVNGIYNFKFLQKFNHEVAVGRTMQKIDRKTTDNQTKLDSFTIPAKYPDERLLFEVMDTDKHASFFMSEKHIPMQGTPNFRDLGGIINKDGRQVKWGAIFRSGALADLTPTDLRYFTTLGIKKVIDFRMPQEMEREPDRLPDSTVVSVHAMIGNPADVGAGIDPKMISKITAEQADEYMLTAYELFINSLSDFQPVFDAMLMDGPETPFLFHCTAGKDRTGISAALILSALNVDREVIMNDYLLSNKYNIPYYESNKEKMSVYGFSADVIKVMSLVKREYLQKVFDAIDTNYGTVENMLEDVFGINSDKRQKLIEKYTISL